MPFLTDEAKRKLRSLGQDVKELLEAVLMLSLSIAGGILLAGLIRHALGY